MGTLPCGPVGPDKAVCDKACEAATTLTATRPPLKSTGDFRDGAGPVLAGTSGARQLTLRFRKASQQRQRLPSRATNRLLNPSNCRLRGLPRQRQCSIHFGVSERRRSGFNHISFLHAQVSDVPTHWGVVAKPD